MHAGCSANLSTPVQGDIRLVNLSGVNSSSAACDEVHFGGVELFNEGQWGRICRGQGSSIRSAGDDGPFADFSIDASVICRQLGFPFGGVYDVASA